MNPTINDLCANLEIGWNLCLGLEGSDCQTTYVVEPNDTIESIADKYKTNSTTVLANNPQLEDDSSNLYIGEVRCVSILISTSPRSRPELRPARRDNLDSWMVSMPSEQ